MTLALFALGLCIWPGMQIRTEESPKLQRMGLQWEEGAGRGVRLDPAHENPERGGGSFIQILHSQIHCSSVATPPAGVAGDSVLVCEWGAACLTPGLGEKLPLRGRASVSTGTVC